MPASATRASEATENIVTVTSQDVSAMPNSHRPPDTRRQYPTRAFCVGVRPAVAPAVPAPPDTLRRSTYLSSGRADSVHTDTTDTTRRSCLYRVWCAGVNWTIALNVFILQTSCWGVATVSSCRESNSHRRTGRDTDKTVLSCLAWRCELAFMRS